MLDINASFCATSLLAFLLAAPSRQAQMNTPPKARTAAMPMTEPTMALESPMSRSAYELVDVLVAEADDVVDDVEVEVEVDVLVEDAVELADDEVDVDVELDEDVSDDEDEVDVAVAVDVLSSLVVVLSALLLLLFLRAWNLTRSSPSRSGCVLSPDDDVVVWHFSVIHSAFSASSSVQPAASRHVASNSASTLSMAMQRVIIELSAHDRSETMLARHALPISGEGAAAAGFVRRAAMATPARLSRILWETIVCSWWCDGPRSLISGYRRRWVCLKEMSVDSVVIFVETLATTLARQTSDGLSKQGTVRGITMTMSKTVRCSLSVATKPEPPHQRLTRCF